MKFTFIAEEENLPYSGYTARKSTVEFKADDLTTLLSNFEDFLKGIGFQIDGMLDIVNDEEVEHDDKINFDDLDFSNNAWHNTDNMSSSWPFSSPIANLDTTESSAPIIIGEDIDLSTIHLGAAQPALDIYELSKNSMNNIEISLNNQTTSTAEGRICPVCKLTENQLRNFKCFDPNCGLKD